MSRRDLIEQHVAQRTPDLQKLSDYIFANPELAFQEEKACKILTSWLEDAGYQVSCPAGGLDTAFVASHTTGRPGPTVAILAEYDALPGIGHGCGHNLIATGAAAAAMAAAQAWPDHPGRLLCIGTPAEEGGAGKVVLADAGVFDSVDAAMMFHPSDRNLRSKHALAATHLEIAFNGKAAHASKTPWEGRSALAAAQVFMSAIESMRQFIQPTARIHYAITNGGEAPQIVPAYSSLNVMVRDTTSASVQDLLRRVTLAAEGAAMATETTTVVTRAQHLYSERLNNMSMADRFAEIMGDFGIPMPAGQPDEPSGSSDIGNVSLLVPTIHPCVQITEGPTPGHSEQFRAAAETRLGMERTLLAGRAMAELALELLEPESDLMQQVAAEFQAEAPPR